MTLVLNQGLSFDRVAKNLDISKNRVYKTYNRGIARIKTALLYPVKAPQSVLYYEKVSGELKQTLENRLADAVTRENFLKERIRRLEQKLVQFAENSPKRKRKGTKVNPHRNTIKTRESW